MFFYRKQRKNIEYIFTSALILAVTERLAGQPLDSPPARKAVVLPYENGKLAICFEIKKIAVPSKRHPQMRTPLEKLIGADGGS